LRSPAVPPKLTILQLRTIHFVPTNIGLSYNVEKTAQTTKRGTWNMTRSSPARLERELQPVSDEYNFQHLQRCTSLAASAGLLSSVTAFDLIAVIIPETICLSRPKYVHDRSWLRGDTPPDCIQCLKRGEVTNGPCRLHCGGIVKIIDPVSEVLKVSLEPMIGKRLDC